VLMSDAERPKLMATRRERFLPGAVLLLLFLRVPALEHSLRARGAGLQSRGNV
jgi:hypothetical protein